MLRLGVYLHHQTQTKKMKVKIEYTEVQYFKNTKEVEMSKTEYNEYLKTGKVRIEREQEMSNETGDECHDYTDTLEISLTKI